MDGFVGLLIGGFGWCAPGCVFCCVLCPPLFTFGCVFKCAVVDVWHSRVAVHLVRCVCGVLYASVDRDFSSTDRMAASFLAVCSALANNFRSSAASNRFFRRWRRRRCRIRPLSGRTQRTVFKWTWHYIWTWMRWLCDYLCSWFVFVIQCSIGWWT